MQIAQVLSGFSLGEADLLRRAMGKKIKKEMAQQRAASSRARSATAWIAAAPNTIFELVAKFAGYGFNKSHAAAYALIAYQTAYLKANHPVEFLAASMTLDIGNTDKLSGFAQEARRIGMRIEPPSVNRSEVGFMPSEGAHPLFARGAEECRPPGRRAYLSPSGRSADASATFRISPAHQSAPRQQARARDARRSRRLR